MRSFAANAEGCCRKRRETCAKTTSGIASSRRSRHWKVKTFVTRGEIWSINLDRTVGAEIRKTRLAIVLSVDEVGALPLRVGFRSPRGSRSSRTRLGSSRWSLTPQTASTESPRRTPFSFAACRRRDSSPGWALLAPSRWREWRKRFERCSGFDASRRFKPSFSRRHKGQYAEHVETQPLCQCQERSQYAACRTSCPLWRRRA